MTQFWNNEKEEELKTLWHKGYSARQIADKMGGVSRNAVIGKAHRLGLSQRVEPPKREFVVTAFAREKKCQWIFGDPNDDDFCFCNLPTINNKPYCVEHCAKAYRRVTVSDADKEMLEAQKKAKLLNS